MSAETLLNKAVEQIIMNVQKYDTHNLFRYPVDKKLALGYYQAIKKPICLENMTHKAKRQEYLTLDMFLQDMYQMRLNAEQYNGVAHEIAELARTLEQAAHEECDKEGEIKEQIEAWKEKVGLL